MDPHRNVHISVGHMLCTESNGRSSWISSVPDVAEERSCRGATTCRGGLRERMAIRTRLRITEPEPKRIREHTVTAVTAGDDRSRRNGEGRITICIRRCARTHNGTRDGRVNPRTHDHAPACQRICVALSGVHREGDRVVQSVELVVSHGHRILGRVLDLKDALTAQRVCDRRRTCD